MRDQQMGQQIGKSASAVLGGEVAEPATAIPRATESLRIAIDQANEMKVATECLADRLFGCLDDEAEGIDCLPCGGGEIGDLERSISELRRCLNRVRQQIARLEDLS